MEEQKLKFKIIFLTTILFGFFAVTQNAQAATEVVKTIKPAGQGGDYTSLSAWEAGENRNLVSADEIAVAKIDGDWTGVADTTAVVVDGWTTDATRYIKIYTTPQARHSGNWDAGKYRLVANVGYGGVLTVSEQYVNVDGLQIENQESKANNIRGIYVTAGDSVSSLIKISNNVVRATGTGVAGSNSMGMNIGTQLNLNIWNNIVYDFGVNLGVGFMGTAVDIVVYNNTFIDAVVNGMSWGFNSTPNVRVYNNLVQGSATNYSINFIDYSGNNLSEDATSPDIAFRSKAVTFVNEAGDDFHLANSDTAAKNAGANLFNDANLPITDDIDGQARLAGEIFDIGADEQRSVNVFYSVGQTAADLKTGSPSVSIASGVATFSVAQVGNIGVGDRITYNTSSIMYISGKISSTVWSVVTATGGTPADISNSTVVSITREYASLFAAEAGAGNPSHLNTSDLVAGNYVLNLPCYYDTGADTTAVSISGWTTGADNYIKIYTPNNTTTEVNQKQRHNGKWDSGKYLLEVTNAVALQLVEEFVRVEGLQITSIAPLVNGRAPLNLSLSVAGGGDIQINNNIFKGHNDSTYWQAGIWFSNASANPTLKIWNNLFYNFNTSIVSDDIFYFNASNAIAYVYNNTAIGGRQTFRRLNGTMIAKNNISQNSAYGFDGTFSAGSDYNISDLVSDAPSPSYRSNLATTVSFVDAANDDFHLASTDTGAKNFGADLTGDANLAFHTDIDGQTRPTGTNIWDIGADEAGAKNVYYSVGQSAADLKTGTPTVSIASGVATFSVAQTGNIGVGDRVTYNTGNKVYISGKISSTQWNVVTATGQEPADITNSTVVSILREYTSLSAAEAGASDSNHLNTTDLVAGNYQLNFPCYYDTGADTTVLAVNGWTTGADNYVKIYTPNNTSTEVNQSQRHAGKWNDAKYRLQPSLDASVLNVFEDHTVIEGLQIISTTHVSWTYAYGIALNGATRVVIKNNIVKAGNTTQYSAGIMTYANVVNPNFIYNNIVYGFSGTNNVCISVNGDNGARYSSMAYNNTAFNCTLGFGGESATYKNNVAQNCTDGFNPWGTGHDFNISNVAGDTTTNLSPSYRAGLATTVTFVDAANYDFHLSSLDGSAKRNGVDLSADANLAFNVDIDGETRLAPWDIGADQIASHAYLQSTEQKENSLTNGLVLYQSFDGKNISGNTALDSSGLGNNGTISGATPAIGKRGQALNFNGTTDRIEMNSELVGVGAASACVWIYPKGWGSSDYPEIFNNNRFIFNIYGSGGRLQFTSNGNNSIFSDASSIAINNWYYVCATRDSSGVANLYINGALSGSANGNSGTPVAGNTSLNIGNAQVGGYDFNGLIDEARIYGRVLSPNEIGSLYRLGGQKINASLTNKNTTGLVGMWSFDGNDISGSTAYDRSGLNNHGAISSAVPVIGKKGQGLDFNGTDSYINAGLGSSLNTYNSDYSYSAWIKLDSYHTSYSTVIAGRGYYDCGQDFTVSGLLDLNPRKIRITHFANPTNATVYGDTDVGLGEWHHVAVSYDLSSGNATFYLDGQSDGVKSINTQLNCGAVNEYIGIDVRDAIGFVPDGKMDEVRIYNRALSADEIGDLYRMGSVKIRR